MEFQIRVFLKETRDLVGLVRGEIIENDVNFLLGFAQSNYIFEEIYKLVAGVTCCRFLVHPTAAHVQSSIQG